MLPIVLASIMGLGNLLLLLIIILALPAPIIFLLLMATTGMEYTLMEIVGVLLMGIYIALYNVHSEYHVFYAEATDCSESICWYGSASPTIICGENNILIYTYYCG